MRSVKKVKSKAPPLPDGITAAGIIERMKEVSEVESDEELASVLGLKKTTISSWRNRNSLPLHECIRIAVWQLCDLRYLILGTRSDEHPGVYEGAIDVQLLRIVLDDYEKEFSHHIEEIPDEEKRKGFRARWITLQYNRYDLLMREALATGRTDRKKFIHSLKSAVDGEMG